MVSFSSEGRVTGKNSRRMGHLCSDLEEEKLAEGRQRLLGERED